MCRSEKSVAWKHFLIRLRNVQYQGEKRRTKDDGHSCKFLHEVQTFKFGWKMERKMEEGRYGEEDIIHTDMKLTAAELIC